VTKKKKYNSGTFANKYLNFLSEAQRMQLWPAWWMMRIKVTSLANDWREVRITLPLTWISGYDVWTRKLSVDFQRPGNTDLELRFDFPLEKEQEIFEELKERNRSTPTFEYGLYRTDGSLCTKIECVVAIREKGYAKGQISSN